MYRWAFVLVALIACSDDEEAPPPVPRCSTGRGIISGDITLDGEPHPGALALVRKMPEDVPLQARADDEGHYVIALAAGHWLVEGRDGDRCTSGEPVDVLVLNCTEQPTNLELECAGGAGGAGGSGGAGG